MLVCVSVCLCLELGASFTTKVDTTENPRSNSCLFGHAVSNVYALHLFRIPTIAQVNRLQMVYINLYVVSLQNDLDVEVGEFSVLSL